MQISYYAFLGQGQTVVATILVILILVTIHHKIFITQLVGVVQTNWRV